MKELTEEELLSRIFAKNETKERTYEEISHPDLKVWGRARGWRKHQSACLIVGLTPISKRYFRKIIEAKSISSLRSWHHFYPLTQKDMTLLQNIYPLLDDLCEENFTCEYNKDEPIKPPQLLDLCEKNQFIRSILSPELLSVVRKYGPHPSIELPNSFDPLEIDPETSNNNSSPSEISVPEEKEEEGLFTSLDDLLPKSKENKEIIKKLLLNYDLRRLKDEQLDRLITRSVALRLWKLNPEYSWINILNNLDFKVITKSFKKLIEKPKEEYEEETIHNWIRDLDPHYKPRKSKK